MSRDYRGAVMYVVTSTGGTVTLTGRVARLAQALVQFQRDIERIPIGSVEFHFAGGKVSCKLVQSCGISIDTV